MKVELEKIKHNKKIEYKIGFTIGKFAPLHAGHQFLIEKALKEMDEFYVLVYETNVIDIPLNVRANWIKKLYPSANIILAKNPPMQYGMDEQSIRIQTDYIKEILKNIPVTHFYSSEEYGKFVARDLKIENIVVDSKRVNVNISATKIRSNFEQYKKFLDESVIKYLKNNKVKFQ